MEYSMQADWIEGIAFNVQVEDFLVRMDSKPPEGHNTGPSPKRMMLASLITCTGMDVAALLHKMRVHFDALHVEATAPLTDEYPKVFKSVFIKYVITGKKIKRAKVEKAITLSQDEYCGVSAMLRKHCPIGWELRIRGG